jgi:hypothetical protein
MGPRVLTIVLLIVLSTVTIAIFALAPTVFAKS